jgi:hypothetical protein
MARATVLLRFFTWSGGSDVDPLRPTAQAQTVPSAAAAYAVRHDIV